MELQLAAGLAACALGVELCGDALLRGVACARPYPRVEWETAVRRLETGDLVVATSCRSERLALVLRDDSGVLYALVGEQTPVPLVAWVRLNAGRQCTWRPLRIVDRGRGAAHQQVAAAVRPREPPLETLHRAGIVSRATSIGLVNCNTVPGYQYDAAIALGQPAADLD